VEHDLTHFSLFTGIGGFDLAGEAAGFRTVGQVEYADFPFAILEKHWPGVPRWRDVRTVTADAVRAAGIGRPTLVSGGFPCQPFSCAGKRRGAEDDRFLWPEMCRIVSELRPAWVLGENVAGFVGMALDACAADLERLGYAVRAFVVPAAGVGAPHQRARCFVVAHASSV
jgi:DNA (cytosine-5)-methyltransferase 1